MKIDPKEFKNYLTAKDAVNKIYNGLNFGDGAELTKEECKALFDLDIIKLEDILPMVS